jgi:hypothetical protein
MIRGADGGLVASADNFTDSEAAMHAAALALVIYRAVLKDRAKADE